MLDVLLGDDTEDAPIVGEVKIGADQNLFYAFCGWGSVRLAAVSRRRREGRPTVAMRVGFRRTLVFVLAFGAFAAPASANHSLTELISTGPTGNSGGAVSVYKGVSPDGKRVYFGTPVPLTSSDTDNSFDVYERSGATTTLVSVGPGGANGASYAGFEGASADGSRVFFYTSDALVSSDTDTSPDTYERSGGTTTLVTTGPMGGNGSFFARKTLLSEDGMRFFFATQESLVLEDVDSQYDWYERSGHTTSLLSTGPSGGNAPLGVCDWNVDVFVCPAALSKDGSHFFFSTREGLVSSDLDGRWDIYERTGGTTALVSTSPSGGNGAFDNGFGDFGEYYVSSEDGSRLFFHTREQLVSGDTDASHDVYERSSGTTTLISTGPSGGDGAFNVIFRAASRDAARVFFETSESLVKADTDSAYDVYERSGGTTTLISTSPSGNFNASMSPAGASADGSRVFFQTQEPLVAADADTAVDVYERTGGATTLVSTGPAGGNGPFHANFYDVSDDGTRAFFSTAEKLTADDTDSGCFQGCYDIYERSGGATTLISTGPSGGSGPFLATFYGVSDDGTRAFFLTCEPLVSIDTNNCNDDIYGSYVAPPVPVPVGGSPTHISLVPAFKPCGSGANGTHRGPLTAASCNPPVPRSSAVAVGSRSLGFTRRRVLGQGECAPFDSTHCYPDTTIVASITDVRSASPTGPDYDPPSGSGHDLTAVVTLPGQPQGTGVQITDRNNNPASDYTFPATVAPLSFPVPVNCTPTSDPSVGSTCDVATTVNSLVPGALVAGKRAVWELGQFQIVDQGANGVPGDADDDVFEVQGVFIP